MKYDEENIYPIDSQYVFIYTPTDTFRTFIQHVRGQHNSTPELHACYTHSRQLFKYGLYNIQYNWGGIAI